MNVLPLAEAQFAWRAVSGVAAKGSGDELAETTVVSADADDKTRSRIALIAMTVALYAAMVVHSDFD